VLGEVLSDLRRALVTSFDIKIIAVAAPGRCVIPAGFAIAAAVPVTVLGWAASVGLPARRVPRCPVT
jgi:hypothetical protein